MDLIRDVEDIDPRYRGGVLSVGVFDGIHLGHRAVLGRTVERARALGVQPVVFTFHPHPLQVLRPAETPSLIQTFGQKLEILREMGIGAVIWPRDIEGVLAMTARDFFDRIVSGALEARAMVEGADFHFGAGAGGGPRELQGLAAARGIQAEFVADVLAGGERISSTRIRRLIAEGRVAEAAQCLGRPYTYVGTVVEGRHRGARLGYPTINVEAPRFLMPAEGVYAARAVIRGSRLAAAVSVGRMATFHKEHAAVVEAFILDFDSELYGEQAAIEFIEYLRPQQAFAGPEALKAQMSADCRRVREIIGKQHD